MDTHDRRTARSITRAGLSRAGLSGAGLAILALALTGCVTGREPGCDPGPLVTDRPDFTESATTVATGRIQVEAGYTVSDTEEATRHELGEALVRIGIGERTELRVGLGSWGVVDRPSTGTAAVRGLTGAGLGAKMRLPAAGLASRAALIMATTVPVSSDLGDPGWTPSALLAAAWDGGAADLGANVGYAHVETADGRGELLASVAAGIPVTERVGSFLELYGHFPTAGDVRAVADAGLTVSVTPGIQLDVRIGRSVVGAGETAFGTGLVVRP